MMKYLFLTAAVCLISGITFADSKTEILQDKVDRMEAELAFIQRKLYQEPVAAETSVQSITATPTNIDDLYSQIDAQSQVIQNLTEKVERLEFDLTTLKNKVDKINADVDFRLNELTSKNVSESVSPPEAKKSSDKDAYEEASGWSNFTKIEECGFKVKTGGLGMVKYDGNNYKESKFFTDFDWFRYENSGREWIC